jgi:phosphoglycolate phosphatase-like HAD superfamily hydrolase
MTVLFWDIDGTLLTTARGGMFAWDDGVKEITGRDFQLQSLRVPGLTDYQIAAKTCELLGLEASDTLVEQLVRRYESLLPTSLPRRVGHVLPNVREILEQLRGRGDVRSYLLTGNTRGGARAKLTHYDLIDFFPEGAFAEDTRARATIAQRALELARQSGDVAEEDMFVIGDTPHDIECANAIGVRTIAVATGGYSVEELRDHRPWQLFERLPPPDEFLRLVGLTGSARDASRQASADSRSASRIDRPA